MTLRFYLDEDLMSHVISRALRSAGLDVVTPMEAGSLGWSDEQQLLLARDLERTLVTFNVADFARLDARWQGSAGTHAGIIIVTTQFIATSVLRDKLVALDGRFENDDIRNTVIYVNEYSDQALG